MKKEQHAYTQRRFDIGTNWANLSGTPSLGRYRDEMETARERDDTVTSDTVIGKAFIYLFILNAHRCTFG